MFSLKNLAGVDENYLKNVTKDLTNESLELFIIIIMHLFLKRPFFHAKLGLDVCPKSSPSTYP